MTKHICKFGEPGFPVNAVERGKAVIVGKGQSFQVADHDFCKVSGSPSITWLLDFPIPLKGPFIENKLCWHKRKLF